MNEQKLQEIIDASPFGFAHHKIIVDDQNRPVDYRFLEVNPVFEELTGLDARKIIGKTVREVIPGIEQGEFDWIGFYGKIAIEGGDKKIEQFSAALGRWYNVHCYSSEKGFFTTFFVDVTEQKVAVEEKLRQAGLIRALLSSIPDLVFFKDVNGVYLGCNPFFAELVGKTSEEEIIGKTDYDLFDKEMADFFRYNDAEMLRQLSSRQNEEEVVFPDGRKILIDTLKTPYRDLEGNVIGILGISRDITERKLAEKRLQESELRLAVAIDGTEAGIWDWDMAKDKAVFSLQWKRMLGYEDAEIENSFDGWKKLWHPDDATAIEKAISDHLAGVTEKYEIIHRCRHKDGYWRWIMTRGKIIRDDGGAPYRWIGTNIDITAQKKAEEELKQKTRMQEMLMELAGTYISLPVEELENAISLSLGRLGEFVGADRVYIFKYDDEKDTCSNTHEWCNEGVPAQIEKLQDIPNSLIPEWVETTRQGGLISIPDVAALPEESGVRQILELQGILSLLVIPMMNEGHCEGFVGFDSVKTHHLYEIEEQRLLTVFVQVLVNVIRRRTMENALKSAVVEAEAASKAKSQFLANMSHEIRTPLNGVIGFTDLLKNTQISKLQQEYVNNANISGHTLLGIINDILDFSKIEAGMLELEVIRTDMVELLENSVDIVKFAAERKGLELLLHIDQKMPRFAFVDPVRVKQILANLMGNAVKFTETGEVEMKVGFRTFDDGKGVFTFAVRDTGIGIDDAQKEKLFKAFSQADSSTTRKFGGTGLGLIISDMIARAMGSKINISSAPDKGSIFFFEITVDVEDGSTLEAERLLPFKRALIIDDNANNRRILEEMLNFRQISFESCENGLEALKKIDASPPFDVIICDYEMPYIDGLETIRIIREMMQQKQEKQAFILMHSSDSEALRGTCDEMGVRSLLRKPVKRDELFNYLSNLRKSENETGKDKDQATVSSSCDGMKKKIRILVAEDIPMNMMLSRAMLSQLVRDVEIFEAQNGLQALEQYESVAPDLVLMDVQMPELDGVEAAKRIREREISTGRHIPIIALTAGALLEEKEKCFAVGMDDFVAKPIEHEKLKNVLDKHLRFRKKETSDWPDLQEDTESHFAYGILAKNLGNEIEIVWELIATALQDMPNKLEQIEQACNAKDLGKIRALAHSIKGAALTMRFKVMTEIAKKIESAAMQSDFAELSKDIFALKSEWAVVKLIIESLKGQYR